MEAADDAEGLNEWEQIQSPWHQTSSSASDSRTTTQSRGYDDGAAVAIIDNYIHDNASVFHPSHHEGLPIFPQQDTPHPHETSLVSADSSSNEGDEVGGNGWRLGSRLRLLSSWMVRFGYGVRSCAACRGVSWSFACVTGVLAVSLVYVKVRRWRRRIFRQENEARLMLLLREKDKQISQLLVQIAQMNNILSGRRTVSVVKVGQFITA